MSLMLMAQTPDGEPPSVEDVCDGLEGSAYGLCNTYCEAKDCDSAAEETGYKSCDRLRDNFFALTNEDIFPCEVVLPGECLVGRLGIYPHDYRFFVSDTPESECNDIDEVSVPFVVPEGMYIEILGVLINHGVCSSASEGYEPMNEEEFGRIFGDTCMTYLWQEG